MNRTVGPAPSPLASSTVLTVSELVLRAADSLVAEFGTVAVEGEVSSFHHHTSSGHMYWTLKDRSSEVRCVMFRRDNQHLEFRIGDGIHVVVVARPTIYRARGQFQLEVTEVLPQGRGALFLQFEALKKKLAAEGLFDDERKRSLPYWPRKIGVVTSPEGAAVRDIVTIVHRRAPTTEVWLKPVAVQGREAAHEIAGAIQWFDSHPEVEVLLVGRGGGSIEDLWAFNEEVVVRAIAECPIPIVSAVGHETDTTLSDYAADLRAATPSAAAEQVVPEVTKISRTLESSIHRLAGAIQRQKERRLEEALAPIRRYGFRRVHDRLSEARLRWADGLSDLDVSLGARYSDSSRRHEQAWRALPQPVIERTSMSQNRLSAARRLAGVVRRRYERQDTRHHHLSERLEAANPMAILERGYSVVTRPDGFVVRSATSVSVGESISIRLAKGRISGEVTGTEPESEAPIEELS